MRKICYITGTRADFGLMRSTLQKVNDDDDLCLEVIVTGMHLLGDYGHTSNEIYDANFKVISEVGVELSGASGLEMSIALGAQVVGITNALEQNTPDLVLLLGDRGEMLAGAIASIHLNIPIVHIHGGERSGSVDESIRHAISKISHYHLVSTNNSKDRLIKMGEVSDNVFVTGAPGLDGIGLVQPMCKKTLLEKYGVNGEKPFFLLLFHPVVQQLSEVEKQVTIVLESLLSFKVQILTLMPNADAGSQAIVKTIMKYKLENKISTAIHVNRGDFLSLVSEAAVLVGNSSSGIIEAASLGTPVLNIGNRQNFRERSNNVIDVPVEKEKIEEGVRNAMSLDISIFDNIYGDGEASDRILNLLKCLDINPKILDKLNAY